MMLGERPYILEPDLPPRLGGAARYHGAVIRAFEDAVVIRVPPEGRHWAREIPALLAACRRTQRSCIITGSILPWGTVAWAARRLGGPPYVVIVHGLDIRSALRTLRKRALARRVLAGAARVIANSTFTASLARGAGALPTALRVVPPPIGITPDLAVGAAVRDVRAHEGLERSRIVLTVARLIPRKGIDTLLRAMAIVQATLPRAALVVIGDGPERDALRTLAQQLRLHARFPGACDDQTIAAWYAASDVFAQLPREGMDGDVEGYGIVYIEAGAFGLPVIATASGGVADAVTAHANGLIVPTDDPAAAAAAILRVLGDDALAVRLGTVGRARAQQHMILAFAAAFRSACAS